jgi:hypothetical protein
MTRSIKTLSIMDLIETLSILTFFIMALSIITLSIMDFIVTLSILTLSIQSA